MATTAINVSASTDVCNDFRSEPADMQCYTGFEWTLIDLAAQWGMDKDTFEVRLQWGFAHMYELEQLSEDRGHWKEKPLFDKGVISLRRMQRGEPTGHIVGLDAICSGMQILSVVTGCLSGAKATGLVEPDVRADAYTQVTDEMRKDIPTLPNAARKEVKQATMTCLYGSKDKPKEVFGEDTPELAAFYQALGKIAPGACEVKEMLRHAWQPYALEHRWTLPDRHTAVVDVQVKEESRIQIDELDNIQFTYKYSVNEGTPKGLSLIANVTHSLDAYLLRSLIRRCNYDPEQVLRVQYCLLKELDYRAREIASPLSTQAFKYHNEVSEYRDLFLSTGIADVSIIQYLDEHNAGFLTNKHLEALYRQLEQMLHHKPFELICIHDEFKCHPNNLNWMRFHYREILAQLAESDVLSTILKQITGKRVNVLKGSLRLPELIRQSNYGIC